MPEDTVYTPEDLLTLPGAKHCELVNGRLVEKEMGFLTSLIAEKIGRALGEYVERHQLGWTPASECGYQCFQDAPRKVRKPDASFLSLERMPANQVREGHVRIAPDLAVEVISPGDTASEVQVKIEEYLAAGVRLVWVLYPATATVHVYRANRTVTWLHEQEELTGEEVIPGFTVRVGDLFPVRPEIHVLSDE